MRPFSLVGIVLLLAVACGDAGSTTTSDPGDAMVQIMEYAASDQRARQWESLHPVHQEVATRTAYIKCSDGGIALDSIEVIEVFEESIPIALLGETETTAITTEVTLGDYSERLTTHLVDVDGEWRWTLDAIDAYEGGGCP